MTALQPGDFARDGDVWATWARLAWWGGFRCRRGDDAPGERPAPDGTVEIVFAPQGREAPPTEAEVQLVQWAIDHEREVLDALLADLVAKYPLIQAEPGKEHLKPPVATADDFRPLIQLVSLAVHDVPGLGGMPYIGFDFECTWAEQHGLGVMMQGPRVVEIGAGDIAFTREIADRDARRTGVLPPFDIDLASKDLAVMAEVGRLRSRTMGRVFLLSWAVMTPFWIVARLGVLGAGVLGAVTAGVLAKAWVSAQTDDFLRAACKKHGVDPKTLNQQKYIIE